MSNINIKTAQDAERAYRAYGAATGTENAGNRVGAGGDTGAVDRTTCGALDPYEAVCRMTEDRETPVDSQAQSVMENFDEYRKDMQERAKSEQTEEQSDEEQQRENAREIARSLSVEEIRQLRRMGVDVNAAELSDLMDLVTTMRADAHEEELANIFAQARIRQGDTSAVVWTSDGAEIAGTDAALTVGEREILYLLKNDLPLDQENLYRASYSGQRELQAEEVGTITEGMKEQLARVITQAGIAVDADSMDGAQRLLANSVPVTTDTIRAYMEMHEQLGTDIRELPTAKQADILRRQQTEQKAAQLVAQVAELTETDIADALSHNRPVTIASMTAARQAVAADGGISRQVRTDNGVAQQTQATATDSADNAEWANRVQAAATTESTETQLQQLTYTRRLEELRLSMTQQAAVRMLRMDINIDTRDLQQVVAKLRTAEQQMEAELFARCGVEPTDTNREQLAQMTQSLQAIGDAPAARLGRLVGVDTAFTVRSTAALVTSDDGGTDRLYTDGQTRGATIVRQTADDGGTADLYTDESHRDMAESGANRDVAYTGIETETIRRSRAFTAAQQEYEALGTAPRADMGDNIRKAFSNIGDMLQEMNLPADAEHVRAVRILGYNSLAVTEENIGAIIDRDRQINDLIAACRPETVLSMIRDGVNPMDVPIDELNRTLRERRYQSGVTETTDFASFLRDVERRGNISEEERAGYIGMYRVLRKLERDGDREAGYLFANDSRLTVRNLITAMRSRRAAGMDVSVDEAFGMLEQITATGARMDAQIEGAFTQTHADAQIEGAFSQASAQTQEIAADDLQSEENLWRELPETDQLSEAERFLQEYEMEENAVNLQAASRILQILPETAADGQTDFYTYAAEMLRKLQIFTLAEDEAVDEETGAMARSLAGEEIPVMFSTESLLEQIAQGEDVSRKYADLSQALVSQMYRQAAAGTVTSADLSGIKIVQAGFRVLGGMARKNRYQLPVETQEGTALVNLTVQTGDASRGTVEIRLAHARYGSLTAHLRADAEGTWTGDILAESSDGNAALVAAADTFSGLLANTEYADADIRLGQVREPGIGVQTADINRIGDTALRASESGQTTQESQPQTAERTDAESAKHADTKKLCSAAVFFVKALVQISDI